MTATRKGNRDAKSAGANGEKVPSGKATVREQAWSIRFGDAIKIERRYIVDGSLTSMTDKGRFGGVQLLGGAEHIVLEDKEDVRMIPLHTVSEIVLQRASDVPKGGGFDPSYL